MKVKALITNVSKKFGIVRLRRLNRPDEPMTDAPFDTFDFKPLKGKGAVLRGGIVVLVDPRILK